MKRGRRLLTLLCLLPLWVAASQTFPIRFVGNRTFSEETLLKASDIPVPPFYRFWNKEVRFPVDKTPTLVTALEDFYKAHGFYHAKINVETTGRSLVVHIQEGPPIRVETVSVLSPLNLADIVPFKKGDRFDGVKFIESKKKILDFYKDHHYCNVSLKAKAFVDIVRNLAFLVYDVTPAQSCVFGSVTIDTPDNIDPKIVASMLYFKEGDLYSAEKIRRTYKEIYAHPGVQSVLIDDSARDGNRVPIFIKVTAYPKPVHLSTGLGYDSDQGVTLKAMLEHRNILGNLHRSAIALRYTRILAYARLIYDSPLPRRRNFHGYVEKRRERFDGYKEKRLRTHLDLSRRDDPYLFRAALLFDRIHTQESEDPIHFPNGTLTLVSPLLGFQIDTRDSILDPTRGYQLLLQATGSLKTDFTDATYYKIKGYASWHKMYKTGVLATKIDAGSIRIYDGRLPPSYRFYAGGLSSNRAYGYRKLGPKNRFGDVLGSNSILEATAEIRTPLGEKFRGVLFCDVTWLGEGPLPDFHKTYLSAGPGIRYLSPMGPIALDVGFDLEHLSRFAIHFHIGELF